MPTWRVPPAGGAAGHALGGWSQRRVQRGAHSCVLCASPGRGRGRNPGVWPWGWATVSSVLGGLALGHGRDFGQQGWLLGKLLTQAGVAMPMVIAAGALAFFAWSLLFPLAPICPLLCLRSLLFCFFFFYLFIFGCAGSSLLHTLSLVAVSRSSSLVMVHGPLVVVASLVECRLSGTRVLVVAVCGLQ